MQSPVRAELVEGSPEQAEGHERGLHSAGNFPFILRQAPPQGWSMDRRTENLIGKLFMPIS
jgi:hypothetical protein